MCQPSAPPQDSTIARRLKTFGNEGFRQTFFFFNVKFHANFVKLYAHHKKKSYFCKKIVFFFYFQDAKIQQI